MSLTDRYELNSPPIVAELVEGEVIAIDLDRGSYYSLEKETAAIWTALISGRSGREILAALPATPEAERLAGELEGFVDALLAEKLIRPSAPARRPEGAFGVVAPWAAETLRFERFNDMRDLLVLDPVHEVDEEAGWPKPLG
jgi:hypothetical protein